MKVAIIHYWLISMRGGEKVLKSLTTMFPEAVVFTHVLDDDLVKENFSGVNFKKTFISKLPFAKILYQKYLPLMPLALEQLDLSDYDLIISSESGPAKGVIIPPNSLHICYCHSPMRYIWDLYHVYYNRTSFLNKLIMPYLAHKIRMWDLIGSFRVDYFIANSKFISKRIERCYRRDSVVIHPPVNTSEFSISNIIEDYYLVLGQLVEYKRVDIAVDAFKASGRKLIIIGDGPMLNILSKNITNNILFLGKLPQSKISQYLSKCRALIFPGVEDFGIVPVEAMASGRPVIAFNKGGILDSVIEGKTGLFFKEQNANSLNKTIVTFEETIQNFDPIQIRNHALEFSKEKFEKSLSTYIKGKLIEKDIY
jgi:glycosyltransferase involved in cell wall biosynthesis